MKQQLLNLWEKRFHILAVILALVLAFSLGMHVQSSREAARQEAEQFDTLRFACDKMEALRDLYGAVNDRSAPLRESATLSVASMRRCIGMLWYTLPRMEIQWENYPDVYSYLHELCYYLLSADCPDYESFIPLAEAARPLMVTVQGSADLKEALTCLADELSTDEGQAIMKTLQPQKTAG